MASAMIGLLLSRDQRCLRAAPELGQFYHHILDFATVIRHENIFESGFISIGEMMTRLFFVLPTLLLFKQRAQSLASSLFFAELVYNNLDHKIKKSDLRYDPRFYGPLQSVSIYSAG